MLDGCNWILSKTSLLVNGFIKLGGIKKGDLLISFLHKYSIYKFENAFLTAESVASISSSVWAIVKNHASYFEGARLIPW